MKRVLKWLGITLLVLLVPILLVIGALLFLGGTETGFNLATREAAERVDGLELGPFEGSLRGGVRTDSLSFENDTIRVEARGVDTAWRLGCLAGREFCLDRAVIDELDVMTFASETPPPETPAGEIALPSIALPIDVTAKEVLVRRLRFRPPGDAPEQVLEDIALTARTEGSRVFLENLSLGYQGHDAALSGSVTLDGDYPLDLALGANLVDIVPESALSGDATGEGANAEEAAEAITDAAAEAIEAVEDAVSDEDGGTGSDAEAADGAGEAADANDGTASRTPENAVDADGTGGSEPPTRDLRVDVALGNTLRELDVAVDVGGALEARLEGRVEPLEKDLPADLALRVPLAGFPLDTREQVRASDLVLTAKGTLDDYALTLATGVSGAQVPETDVELAGSVSDERLLLTDIDVGTLGGSVTGSAALSWVDGLAWLGELDLAELDPSRQLETLAGELGGRFRASGEVGDDGSWTLDLREARLEGTLQGYPFTLDARVEKGADDVFRIETLSLDNGDNRLDASGSVSDEWDIRADAALPQLQNFLPGLAGGFDAELALSGPLAEPSVALDASASAITLNDTVVEGLRVRAEVARAALEPSALNVAVGQVQIAGQTIANIRLGLEGTRAEHALTLFADGPQATAIDLAAAGGLNERFDWLGSLEAVTLEVPAHVIRLREPTALAWDGESKQFAVDPHCWVTEETNLCLENKVLAEADGTALISIDRYPLERLNPFLPAESTLAGALAVGATVAWGEAQPGGFSSNVSLSIEDGGASVLDANEEPVTFSYDTLTLEADVDPTDVRASLAVDSETMGEARFAVRLNPAGEEKPIEGRVDLDGFRIDFVQAFLPDFEEISGTINAGGDLSGRLSDPRFDGAIVLADPVVRSGTLPLAVEGGEVTTNVRGRRAFVDGFIATNDEGSIRLEGSANWQELDAWRADVTLIGEALALRQEPLSDSRVNHEITIGARPGEIRVNGDVGIPFATIDVRELPKGAATLSDDIVIVEDVAENAGEAATVDPPGATDLVVDVAVTLGDEVSLDAYGLTANLTGEMSVSLRSPNPVQLGGEILVVDGIYRQYGQNLEASGQILFVGPVDRTALDIEAIRRIETEEPERIVGLKITGDVASPDISLFTEPSDKSEEAILSYIVLGRDIGETSDQEANLLATAALALSVRGGRSVGQNIADTLGIEEFALETRGRGDETELVVSGRLSDRLLLRYGQSVFDAGASTLYLRYDLTRKLYLEAAQGLESAVDLFYQFSF